MTFAPKGTNEITLTPLVGLIRKDRNNYKIHITLGITEVTKILMVAGFPQVPPQVAGVDKLVPGMVVATGVARGSAKGQAQNRAGGRSGVHVEGIPRKGKETPVTDTGTNTPQRCRD